MGEFEYKNNSLLLLKFKENPALDCELLLESKVPASLVFLSKVKNNEKLQSPLIPVRPEDLILVKLLEGTEVVSSHLSLSN